MTSPYYSVGELAVVLKCSTKWVYQQINKGNIPGIFHIGKSPTWFIDKEVFHSTLKEVAQRPQRKEMGGKKSRHNL